MACFLVSAAEAAAVAAAEKAAEKREENESGSKKDGTEEFSVSLSTKLKWLRNMLLGGSILLAFEHIWHGEVVPWFPFLTAMSNPEDMAEMLGEMATVGVTMACLITAVWFCMCIAANVIVKRPDKALTKNVK